MGKLTLYMILFGQFLLLMPVLSAIGKLRVSMSQVIAAKVGYPYGSKKANEMMDLLVPMNNECNNYVMSQYRTIGVIMCLILTTIGTHFFELNMFNDPPIRTYWASLLIGGGLSFYMLMWSIPGLQFSRNNLEDGINKLIMELDTLTLQQVGNMHLNLDKPFDITFWTKFLAQDSMGSQKDKIEIKKK